MRDITKEIEERIDEVEAERAQLQRRMEGLAEKAEMLRDVLEYERTRWPEQPILPGLDGRNGHRLSSPISRFVMTALGDPKSPVSTS